MALRSLLTRGLPELPEEAPSLRSVLADALNLLPLAPLRIFWNNLVALRPWWPLLLPMLAWIGWRSYQRERAEVLDRRGARG